jgi:hypothetical protein
LIHPHQAAGSALIHLRQAPEQAAAAAVKPEPDEANFLLVYLATAAVKPEAANFVLVYLSSMCCL